MNDCLGSNLFLSFSSLYKGSGVRAQTNLK